MYYGGPQRPLNVYYPRPVSSVISPVYSPTNYSSSYYDHSPEMRMVPLYGPQYAQPSPHPQMVYRNFPMHYHHRYERPCCSDICCDRCCDECCGPQCCC